MNTDPKLTNDVSQNEIMSFRSGLYIGAFSVAALFLGLFWVLLYSHSARRHTTPKRIQLIESEPGSFSYALTALQEGAVVRREADNFYGKYRLENGAIVRFFGDEKPGNSFAVDSFRVDEILADDWIVEPKR